MLIKEEETGAERRIQKKASTHFGDSPQLPGSVVAADLTDRQGWVEQFHEPLGVQLQVAEQRLHT